MTCSERQDLILLSVAGALDDAERAELDAHLRSGCARCAGAQAEALAVANHVPLLLDPVAPSAQALGLLMAKIESPQPRDSSRDSSRETVRDRPRATDARRPGSTRPRWWTDWVQPLLIALIATAVTWFAGVRLATESLREDLADYGHKIVRRMTMAGVAPRGNARADIAWDPPGATWWVDVHRLPPAPPGRALVLWVIRPDDTKVAATTFNTSRAGRATLRVPLPTRVGEINGAIVTEEPADGPRDKPMGPVYLRWKQ